MEQRDLESLKKDLHKAFNLTAPQYYAARFQAHQAAVQSFIAETAIIRDLISIEREQRKAKEAKNAKPRVPKNKS